MSLTGKIALVTGASRGIGLAVADELRAAGAHVVRLARSLTDGSADRQTDIRCDVSRSDQVDRAVGTVVAELGVPHILVSNAGNFFVKSLGDTTPADFTDTLAVNLAAPFLVARALSPRFVERDSGHLVTIGSISDYRVFTGSSAYGASKWGLRGLHEVIRAETAGTGVRTTLVSPGPVDTPIWDPIDPDTKPGFTKRAQMLVPEDVADAVLWAVTRREEVDVTEVRLVPTRYAPRG